MFAVGAFALLFDGLRLLVSNWRLTLVQVLPAVWIWVAMLDLKLHVLHGHSFNVLRGPILAPIILAIVAITAASFFLNAVFAFAISRPGAPEIRPAVAQARRHLTPILVSGAIVGLLLALSTTVVTRWGRPWFTVSLGVVVGMMMVSYVAVPARLIGAKPAQSRRERLTTSVVSSALGATVCAPPYLLGRVGLLMLGSKRSPDSRDRLHRIGRHAAGGRNRGGQGDQDERQPHRDPPGQPRHLDPADLRRLYATPAGVWLSRPESASATAPTTTSTAA